MEDSALFHLKPTEIAGTGLAPVTSLNAAIVAGSSTFLLGGFWDRDALVYHAIAVAIEVILGHRRGDRRGHEHHRSERESQNSLVESHGCVSDPSVFALVSEELMK